jgi:hypothetical protein
MMGVGMDPGGGGGYGGGFGAVGGGAAPMRGHEAFGAPAPAAGRYRPY